MTRARAQNSATKRKRDYRAEYRRRKALAKARGLSSSQARGHPKSGELPVSARTTSSPSWTRILERGIKHLRSGESLTQAAKLAGVSTERLRAYIAQTGIAKKKGRSWIVDDDQRIRRMQALTTAGRVKLQLAFDEASLNGSHESAVGRFLEDNDTTHLKPFRGQSITDIDGKRHIFETRPNVLYRLANSGGESFEQVYRIISK